MCHRLDSSTVQSGLMDSLDYILTDCDGVLWNGNEALPGVPKVLRELRKKGKKIIFVTNNSSKTRKEYVAKCEKLAIEASEDEIFSTSYCAAVYLSSIGFKKKVYIVGLPSIAEELRLVGIESLPTGPDPVPSHWLPGIPEKISMDPEVGAVIVGYDSHISYVKIMKAASYLNKKDCLFLATNTDEKFPFRDPVIIVPGSGALVAAVQVASGREPIILGKPSSFMFECIKKKFPDLKPERSIMIGDRLTTDIQLGKQAGMRTLLVLTGVSTLEEAERYKASSSKEDQMCAPDYWLPKLGDLEPLIQS